MSGPEPHTIDGLSPKPPPTPAESAQAMVNEVVDAITSASIDADGPSPLLVIGGLLLLLLLLASRQGGEEPDGNGQGSSVLILVLLGGVLLVVLLRRQS